MQRIPWLRILAEGAVIVVSILLAFWIDRWSESARDRELESEVLAGLERDFTRNASEITQVLEVWDELRARVEQLAERTEAELRATPADILEAYWSALGARLTFESRDGTLDALVASGRLDTISDRELRELLVAWGPLLADADEEAALIRANSQLAVRAILKWEPEGLTGSTSQPELASTLIASRKDREVVAAVRAKEFAVDRYLEELEWVRELAEQVVERIRIVR